MKLNLQIIELMPFGNSFAESQGDSILQPRVARNELPWVDVQTSSTLKGLNSYARNDDATPLGLKTFLGRLTQPRKLSGLGWMISIPLGLQSQRNFGSALHLYFSRNFRNASRHNLLESK